MSTPYPVAAGEPNYHGNAVPNKFVSEFMLEFYETCYLYKILNTKYEGVISKEGDKITFRYLPEVDIIDDLPQGGEVVYPPFNIPTVDMYINKSASWGFPIDDIKKLQSDLDLVNPIAKHYAERAKRRIEQRVLAYLPTTAHANNKGATAGKKSAGYNLGASGSPVAFSASNATEVITYLSSVLGEQDAPMENRWVVLPEILCNKLQNSELRKADLTGDAKSTLRTGYVGDISGLSIYKSNLVSQTTDGGNTVFNVPFGQKDCVTFAEQLTKVDGPFMRENQFGHAMRGLQVFGYQTIKPEGVGLLYARAA